MQNWTRLYHYIHEYQQLVQDYYSKHAVAFITTYYNLSKDNTVWDKTDLMGGAYERTGEYSGLKYNKYLLLPVYFAEEMVVSLSGEESGYEKQGAETTITIPSSYGITPYPGDFVKFEQAYLNPTDDSYPIYIVTNPEIASNTQRRFWKLKLEVYQSKSLPDVDDQIDKVLVFFDYDKKIYPLEEATNMAKMMQKNAMLKGRIEKLWDPNTGFFKI